MANSINDKLYDSPSALYVLSCLMRKPLLLQDERYVFTQTDFYKQMHTIIFYAVYNMAQEGCTEINPQTVDIYLQQYASQYAAYKQQNGYQLLQQCYDMTSTYDGKLFERQYNTVKKFSMLRDLNAQGIDIREFFNTDVSILDKDIEVQKLEKLTLQDIVNKVREKVVGIENKHIGKSNGSAQNISKGLRALVQMYEEVPEVGLPLDGKIINYAVRGLRLGKLYTYSAPTGGGKTRTMVGMAASISMPYIDRDMKVVLRGEHGSDYSKVLFVTTEQAADEIQTLVLAYVSGVNEESILMGNYSDIERKRISYALDIIDKFADNFIVIAIPDPSIALIKATLAKFIVQDNVQYIFYDYIFSSPGLLSEFRDVAVREDVALMMLSNSLKEIAMVYNVFIQSATQLNDSWAKIETGPRNQNCLRASKAIADKIDVGLIGVRLSEVERKAIAEIWEAVQKKQKFEVEPNIVVDIYKNRRGQLNNVKILRYFDFGTCRSIDLFVVTADAYKAVDKVTEISFAQEVISYEELKREWTNGGTVNGI